MAIGRVKTWIVEVLTASDLNAEFNNIINNALSLISPLTGTLDANGNEIILDADADTSITADTDDRLDVKLSGTDLFRFNGTVTTPVNGIDFVASATGVATHAIATGTDTNIDLELRSKGSGDVVLADDSGNEILIAADVASAVNEVTVTNAVTTAPPFIQATGGDTNIDLELRSKGSGDVVLADDSGNEILIAADVASAVNEITITNAATGNAPIIQSSGETNIGFQLQDSNGNEIILGASTASAVNEITATNAATANAPALSATGGDTNIDLNLVTKGTGQIDIGTGGATQAEMEAATAADKIVTPDSAQWHPGVAKAWVNFNGTGTVAIRTSHNVTSITDNGVGLYTVNFTTAFSSADYTLGGTANFTGGGGAESVRIVSLTTTSAQVRTLNADVATDLSIITINFFGDQ